MGNLEEVPPGTQLVKRLKRGDHPRTASDKEAMAHDSRYQLASNYNDVRRADNIMINVMKRLRENKLDDPFNTTQGLRLIQAKTKLEDMGLPKNSFASFGGIDPKDKPLVEGKLAELEKQGYGKKPKPPSHRLKMKLLTNLRRAKKYDRQTIRESQQGDGVVSDVLGHISSKASAVLLPYIKKYFQRGLKNYQAQRR